MSTWVEGVTGSGYDVDHLPYGLVSPAGGGMSRLAVRIGDQALDLLTAGHAGLVRHECTLPSLKPLMAAGPGAWVEVRETVQNLFGDERHRAEVEPMLAPLEELTLHLPFEVADYVDFYSSEEHATNLGKMFRPGSEALLPNWKHLPVGYHGRSGTVIVSGTTIHRPHGQRRGPDGPEFGPTQRLDIELEVGVVVGASSRIGQPVPVAAAGEHIFGMLLVNDWSARDIQAWEYVPLGPFLGKSFSTSIGAWVTPLAALEPFRISQSPQDPQPLPYLRGDEPWGFDLDLEVLLSTGQMRIDGAEPHRISQTNFRHMYWTPAQQLAHMTVNGASTRTGDLFASGTISGSEPGTYGSFIELTWNGENPIELPNGETRSFLEDGDEVTLRGSGGEGDTLVQLADVVGRVAG